MHSLRYNVCSLFVLGLLQALSMLIVSQERPTPLRLFVGLRQLIALPRSPRRAPAGAIFSARQSPQI